jgi:hypothetical protein
MIAATAAATGVYRKHFPFKKDPADDLGGAAVSAEYEAILDALVACTQQAHTELLDLSCLTNWTAVDGYTSNCLDLLKAAVKDPDHAYDFQLITAAGYGIERRCYQIFDDWVKAHPPAYFACDKQVASGMARPDIVLAAATGTMGAIWVDLTSEASRGHILKKVGAKGHYCEEILYPPVDFNLVLNGVMPNMFTSANLQKKEAIQFIALQDKASDEKKRGEIADLYRRVDYQFPAFKAAVTGLIPAVDNSDVRAILMFAGFAGSKESHWVDGKTPNGKARGRKLWEMYQEALPEGGKVNKSGRISKPRKLGGPY